MIDIIGTGFPDMSKVIIKPKLLYIMNLLSNLHPVFAGKLLLFIDNYSSGSLRIIAVHYFKLLRISL